MRCTGVPQTGHGWPKRPCTAIPSRNAVTFSGNPSPASRAQPLGPLASVVARRRVQSRAISVVVELARQLERRQPRAMQDLVRVRVADAAEEVRIGQRALERVVLAPQRRGEVSHAAASATSRPPGSSAASAALALHDVQRRALLRARLGQQQRAVREIERREPDLARHGVPRSRQCSRPAIIRCKTRNSSPSSPRRCACRCAAGRSPSGPSRRRAAARPSAAGTAWPAARARASARRCAAASAAR